MDVGRLRGPVETSGGIASPVPTASRTTPGPPVTESSVSLLESRGEALLADTGRRTDPASGSATLDVIEDRLARRDLNLGTVLLTYYHYDHVGNARALAERHDAEVVCHRADRPVVEERRCSPGRRTSDRSAATRSGWPRSAVSTARRP